MSSLYRIAFGLGLTVWVAASAQAEEWKVAKNEEGINVSLSEVPGSQYKAYQGVTTIKAGIGKLRALQEDVVAACASCKRFSSTRATRPGPTRSSIRRGR
jgi:hypothetical protein